MSNIRDREGFAQHYAGHAPWDIGKPQHALVEIADQIRGPLLDAGCGTGDTSIFFAARGLEVTGIDFVDVAIQRATVKAKDRGVRVEFLVKDATELHAWNRRFESVIDC